MGKVVKGKGSLRDRIQARKKMMDEVGGYGPPKKKVAKKKAKKKR